MPLLSWAQRRTGRELRSRSAVADSKQTLLCTYLSAVLLVGLGLNSLFGWSWADPIAGLREIIHPPFRIVYRVENRRIRVVRVWRSERLLRLP